jgi:hypothetical protein
MINIFFICITIYIYIYIYIYKKKGMAFHDRDLCLADSATTHTILKEKKYFEYLTLTKTNVTTISGPTNMIKSSRRVIFCY